MSGPIRTLLFSTLFPSSVRPVHGIFVETRLRELLKTRAVTTKVVAPVPWFPFSGERFGEYGKFAATPYYENQHGIDVFHPRYFLPPKVGMNVAPHLLALGAMPSIRKLIRDGFDFDLIDAHYYYPDGAAARIIAERLGKPFIVTARGTDLNLLPDYAHPRRQILRTAESAAASICVSGALARKLGCLGGDAQKIHVFRNGIDLERFHPLEKAEARRKLGLSEGTILLSVGNLIELKGHHLAIEALSELPSDTRLIIAGIGPERQHLEKLAIQLGVASRTTFAGQIDNRELKWWYSAADVLLLCSSREGWANVLLEAMACGTPVVATPVGGTPEIIGTSNAGRLMSDRSTKALLAAYENLRANYPERHEVREYAEQFSWQETSSNQLELFKAIAHA